MGLLEEGAPPFVELAEVVRRWRARGLVGWVWDNAAFHRLRAMEGVGLKRIYQPPYLPEVNPLERAEKRFGGMWRGGCMGV